jgi:hypothetical protein
LLQGWRFVSFLLLLYFYGMVAWGWREAWVR